MERSRWTVRGKNNQSGQNPGQHQSWRGILSRERGRFWAARSIQAPDYSGDSWSDKESYLWKIIKLLMDKTS